MEFDKELILKYKPVILMDEKDPFPVKAVGCSIFKEPEYTLSFRNWKIDPAEYGAAFVIEYAVYFDYDIQHLYDLEHIWAAVGADGSLVDCWSSFHGLRAHAWAMPDFRREGTHPVLYCQPGKHAFMPDPTLFLLHSQFKVCCNKTAGGGMLVPWMLENRMHTSPDLNMKIKAYMRKHYLFEPALKYEQVDLPDEAFIPVEELLEKIPVWVEVQTEKILNEES